MTELPARRLLLVHAHPDDESINNGATMAAYAAAGARVTLVTCTLGEHGEVIPPELAHLTGAALGEYRLGELTAAMRELGVDDFRLLGGAGRYRDSGMTGLPDNDDPACFWQADVDEAAAHLVEVMVEASPGAAYHLAVELCARLDLDGATRERIAELALGGSTPLSCVRGAQRPTQVAVLSDHGSQRVVVVASRKVAGERRWRRWAVLIGAHGAIEDCLHEDRSNDA